MQFASNVGWVAQYSAQPTVYLSVGLSITAKFDLVQVVSLDYPLTVAEYGFCDAGEAGWLYWHKSLTLGE
jgi:hypothetical protein